MNKNETLIRKIAEEMANEIYFKLDYGIGKFKSTIHFASLNLSDKNNRIDRQMPAARIAVKHMAEIAKEVWWKEHDLRSIAEQQLFDIYLSERGLIPPTEKEVNHEQ